MHVANVQSMITRCVATIAAVLLVSAPAGVSAAVDAKAGVPIVGGSSAQREILRDVVHALGGTQISKITIVPLGQGRVRLVMQPARLDRSRPNVAVRLEWDASMVTYAFLRRSRLSGLPAVEGFSVGGKTMSFRTPNPRILPRFDRTSIAPPVGRAVRRSGAKVIEFNLFRPAGPAFAVVVQSDHPARFLQRRLEPIIVAMNGVTPRLDGFYVAVTDPERRVVFAYGRAEQRGVSTATVYVRDDLAGCAENLPVSVEVAPDGAPSCPSD